MLSHKTLERVSASYRRGYYDGYEGKPAEDAKASTHPFDRPFANRDYAAGHKAGANDRKWSDIRSAQQGHCPQGCMCQGCRQHTVNGTYS